MSRHAVRATVAVAALSFAVLSSPIQAQDKPSAQEFTDLHALAEAGDTEAQYNLGLMYFNGRGVAQDDVEAVAWYRQAAGQGHAKAQTRLGVMYDTGKGVAQQDLRIPALRLQRVGGVMRRLIRGVRLSVLSGGGCDTGLMTSRERADIQRGGRRATALECRYRPISARCRR